jgi:hypothetical protein
VSLILDSYGRPILYPGDVIAIRKFNGRSFQSEVRHPLRVTRIQGTNHPKYGIENDVVCTCATCGPAETYRIYFKEDVSGKEDWVFSDDVEVKLLARPDDAS